MATTAELTFEVLERTPGTIADGKQAERWVTDILNEGGIVLSSTTRLSRTLSSEVAVTFLVSTADAAEELSDAAHTALGGLAAGAWTVQTYCRSYTGTPTPARSTAEACGELGHPGATYNPWLKQTWCLCGAVIRDGNHFQHITCCGGPLDRAGLSR